jgi:hypothetical protein
MLRQARTVLRLAPSDRWLLLAATALLVAFRLGLMLVPLGALRRLSRIMARAAVPAPARAAASPERIGWAVAAAARLVPGAACLAQALAGRVLLQRRGFAPVLRIGVRRDGRAGFQGHAWIECQGKIVVGAQDAARYTPLPVLEGGDR